MTNFGLGPILGSVIFMRGGVDIVQQLSTLFSTAAIEIWMQSETSGIEAVGRLNGYSGTYVGVDLANISTPWGLKAPLYDGVNDYLSMPDAIDAAFDHNEGSLIIAGKIFDLATWSDGIFRRIFEWTANATNRIRAFKTSIGNINLQYTAGGTTITKAVSTATIDWFVTSLDWSVSSDRVFTHYNGSQVGAGSSGLGTWNSGNLITEFVGSETSVPTNAWKGWIGPVILIGGRRATSDEHAAVAEILGVI